MNIDSDKFDKKTWSLVAVGLLFLSGLTCLFVFKSLAASADGERLITIHDKNSQKTVITEQPTVGQMLKQAKVSLQPYDRVDPSLDTEFSARSYHVNIYRAHPVLVIDGNARQTIMTPTQTPAQIAASAKRPLQDEDKTILSQSGDILSSDGTGLQLEIDRAIKINLVLYGKLIEARTQAATVGEMMKHKKIELAAEDTVSVPLATPISTDMRVEIWRNGKQTINEEQPVAFPIQQIQDADQPIGYKAIKTAGVLGKKNVTYEIEMRNGQELSRRAIQEIVTLAPQQQVEIVGAKPTFSGSFGDALAKLRACEAGGSYSRNSGNGFYGAYQYDVSTWGGYGGYTYASDAPPAVQDQKTWQTYQRRGWAPWPSCGSNLPDSYR